MRVVVRAVGVWLLWRVRWEVHAWSAPAWVWLHLVWDLGRRTRLVAAWGNWRSLTAIWDRDSGVDCRGRRNTFWVLWESLSSSTRKKRKR